MYMKTLEDIRTQIRESRMKTERKEDVLRLLEDLEKEVASQPEERRADAEKIAELSAEPENISKLKEFEVQYPDVVRIVNRICTMLSDLGI